MANKKLAEFLLDAYNSIPVDKDNIHNAVIATHLMSKFKETIENPGGEKFQKDTKNLFKPTVRCEHCFTPWKSLAHDRKILPSKKITKTLKRILKRSKKNPPTLNNYERNFLPRINNNNKLVLKCPICTKRTVLPMHKKPLKEPVKIEEPTADTTEVEGTEDGKKKRRKRKKDKLCGLTVSLPQTGKLNDAPDRVEKTLFVPKPKQLQLPPINNKKRNTKKKGKTKQSDNIKKKRVVPPKLNKLDALKKMSKKDSSSIKSFVNSFSNKK